MSSIIYNPMISTLLPTKQAEKKYLTYSALSTYRRYPMRYNLRYEKNLIPVDTDFKLWLGMVVHKGLEVFYGTDGNFEFRKELVLAKIDDACKGWEKVRFQGKNNMHK